MVLKASGYFEKQIFLKDFSFCWTKLSQGGNIECIGTLCSSSYILVDFPEGSMELKICSKLQGSVLRTIKLNGSVIE